MRYILATGEESDSGPALHRYVLTNRAAQHRIARVECIEYRTLGDYAVDFDSHLAVTARERLQVVRQHDPDHESVWVSTDNTAGRSRTIGSQLSPLSLDA